MKLGPVDKDSPDRRRGYNVLAVDDDPENVETIRRILHKKYRVLTATSGSEALGIFGKEPIEMVITDQRMPEMTGTEMLRRAMEIAPNIIRIMVSAYADREAMAEAINTAKVDHFLFKPITRDELLIQVDRAFARLEGDQRCLWSCGNCDRTPEDGTKRPRVLVVSQDPLWGSLLRENPAAEGIAVKIAKGEYECSCLVGTFAPHAVIVDGTMGDQRARNLISCLTWDPRIPAVQIILADEPGKLTIGKTLGYLKSLRYDDELGLASGPRGPTLV